MSPPAAVLFHPMAEAWYRTGRVRGGCCARAAEDLGMPPPEGL